MPSVFFNRLGEMRDRSFEKHSLFKLCDRRLKARPLLVDDNLLEHLSPLGWEHINLTGDYVWRQNRRVESGKFRPLRPAPVSQRTIFSFVR
jgi:Tn3 transposase DDE domain